MKRFAAVILREWCTSRNNVETPSFSESIVKSRLPNSTGVRAIAHGHKVHNTYHLSISNFNIEQIDQVQRILRMPVNFLH
jgi:hypothetical protein